MSGSAQAGPLPRLPLGLEPIFAELYLRSGAIDVGISSDQFTAILLTVGRKYLPEQPSIEEARQLYCGLRIEDLALARACACGNERAWERFMARFREKLYDCALAIAREESVARELADSLYADLYGTNERGGRRVSKLDFYMGRGSLDGWLRTVLAQEYINRYRSHKRLVSLEQQEEEGPEFAAADPDPVVSADPQLGAAVAEAFRALPAEDRVILSAYFLDRRTLADIGRMLGFHEATASRKLDRITKALRKSIRDALMRRGMSRRQAEEALEVDVRDVHIDVRQHLSQVRRDHTFQKERSPT